MFSAIVAKRKILIRYLLLKKSASGERNRFDELIYLILTVLVQEQQNSARLTIQFTLEAQFVLFK